MKQLGNSPRISNSNWRKRRYPNCDDENVNLILQTVGERGIESDVAVDHHSFFKRRRLRGSGCGGNGAVTVVVVTFFRVRKTTKGRFEFIKRLKLKKKNIAK